MAVAQLLSRMSKTFNVSMTTAVYNALLELCANSNDVARAEELMDRMLADGIEPDEYTEAVVERKRALRAALKRTFA
jgi:pentatricopeptide repeat protein